MADTSADSEFYFAVSMREIARFLLDAKVAPHTTGEPCRSLADLDQAERERVAGAKAQSDAEQRAEAEKRAAALQAATRTAEMEVIAARENHLALAGLALLLALAAAGTAVWAGQQGRTRERKLATVAAAVLAVLAPVAWLTRPSIAEIDSRAQDIVGAASATPAPAADGSTATGTTGPAETKLACVFNPARSRVTVSDTADVPLVWRGDGCVNGRTQYGLAADGWSKVLAPNGEDTVTVASYDPATRTYRQDRYLLEADAMGKVRSERAKLIAPACGAGEGAARQFGDAQGAVRALLPAQPIERLVYDCRPAP